MSFISNYLENKLVEHVFRANTMVSPAEIYVALYSSDPGEDNSGVELIGNGYTREIVTFGLPSDGVSYNDTDVVFNPATSDWPTVSHVAVFDLSAGGNMLFYGPLSASISITSGNNFRLPAGNLAVGFD